MVRVGRRRVVSGLVCIGAGMLLGGCGAVDAGAPASSGFSSEVLPNQLVVNADSRGTLRWERQEYTGLAGDVTFVVNNPSTIAHNFVLEGAGVKAASKTIGAKKSANLTLKGLSAGEYLIVCTLPGHREAGMVARLTLA